MTDKLVPQIKTTAASPSQPDAQGGPSKGLLTVQGVAPPSFSPMPPSGAELPPTPTMFPLTQEKFGHAAQPAINAKVTPTIDCPSPNPVDVNKNLKVKPPPVSPLPSPGSVPSTPRLTEADAQNVDIWFFRNEIDGQRGEFPAAEGGGLTQWKVMKADGDNLIPITPVPSR